MKTNRNTITEPILMVDNHHGTYIPQVWLKNASAKIKKQLTPEQRNDLRDPESEFYWETWESVLNKTFAVNRQKGFFEQTEDGDVFFIPACFARSKEFKEWNS